MEFREEIFSDWHIVVAIVYNSYDAGLDELLGAHEARERSNVGCSTLRLRAAALNDGVLLSMDTVASVESSARGCHRIASLAASIFAVLHSERRSIVPSCDNAAIFDDHAADCAFHAIRAF